MSKGWIATIIIAGIVLVGATVLYLMLGKKKPAPAGGSGGTGTAAPANGLQTNPGTSNPESDPEGYELKIGDKVYNRGTVPFYIVKTPNDPGTDQFTRIRVEVNQSAGTITGIWEDGLISIDPTGNYKMSPGTAGYVRQQDSNKLGL